jgi:hypothetical protein
MTKNIFSARGLILALVGIVALATSACGTAGAFKATNYGTDGRVTAEQSASPRTTRNYMIDIYTRLESTGHMAPQRDLTIEESIGLASIDQHCARKVAQIEGLVVERARLMGTFSVTGLISQVAGASQIEGANIEDYGSLGAASFLGSGAMSAQLKIEQGLTILHSSCMMQWVNRDPLLDDIMIYPVISGRALRPRMGTAHSETDEEREARYQREDREIEDRRNTLPIVPM